MKYVVLYNPIHFVQNKINCDKLVLVVNVLPNSLKLSNKRNLEYLDKFSVLIAVHHTNVALLSVLTTVCCTAISGDNLLLHFIIVAYSAILHL